MTKAAVIQMVSVPDVQDNLAQAGDLIESAKHRGARLVILPENFAFFGAREADRISQAEFIGEGPVQDWLSKMSAGHAIWLVGGTIPIRSSDEARCYAASLVYNPQGRRVARYDKIHLFDVDVPGSQEKYLESASTLAGSQGVTVETELGHLGLTVCYDLRFPELYREYTGVDMISVPSAFTARTGRAHWEILLRARAVENLCYVLAPNQGGTHANNRKTWGHSMIVDPWGRILDSCDMRPGLALADIDNKYIRELRTGFPCLNHRRSYE